MMGNFLLPLLILVILIIIGLTIWLSLILTRNTSRKREKPGKTGRAPAPADPLLSVQQNERGLWEVRVRNVPYQRLSDVPDPKVRAQVVNAIRIVAGFGRDYIAKQKASAPKGPAKSAPPRQDTPAPSLPDAALRLRRPSTPPQLMPQIDLANEIGEILEEIQRTRPSLEKRTVRLQNAPDGGVLFVIDGKTYTKVSEISDLEIQALIRDATREWEKR